MPIFQIRKEWGSRGRWFESSHSDQKKRSRKIFGQKTKRFQGFGGPWITKIQGPQNLDLSPLPIHSDKTQTRRQIIEKEGAKRSACILGVDPSALTG